MSDLYVCGHCGKGNAEHEKKVGCCWNCGTSAEQFKVVAPEPTVTGAGSTGESWAVKTPDGIWWRVDPASGGERWVYGTPSQAAIDKIREAVERAIKSRPRALSAGGVIASGGTVTLHGTEKVVPSSKCWCGCGASKDDQCWHGSEWVGKPFRVGTAGEDIKAGYVVTIGSDGKLRRMG